MPSGVTENQILHEALDALRAITAVKVDILPFPKGAHRHQTDALLKITINGNKQLYVAEIKAVDRRIAVGQIQAQLQELIEQHYPGYRPLLIIGFATPFLAEECRKLDLPFLDTAGNLYLHNEDFLIDIRGKARPNRTFKDDYRANNRAGLKITFALLCQPNLVVTNYREIAKFAQVGLGTIGPVLADLARRGYIQRGKTPACNLVRMKELINEWVTNYPATLRPTLHPRRYQADRERLMQIDLAPYGAYWGGEYGAEKLTRYLKAERFTIYIPGTPPPTLMTQARMRLAEEGNVEILQMFWNPDINDKATPILAPPLLIYADLMATADPRNLEAAKEIYERFLEPIANQR